MISRFYIKKWLIIFSLIIAAINIHAQVTIGSSVLPNSGALLDLKEDGSLKENSTRGLLLPRVKLTSKNTLVDIAGDNLNAKALTGLTVFNVNENIPFCKNVYMWNSTEWIRIGPTCPALIMGLQDIDFGVSANEEKSIDFKINASWRYTADSNLNRVLSSYQFAPNETHQGGTEEVLGDVSFKIESGDYAPAAGTEVDTRLTFSALDGAQTSQTITVKRKVPTHNVFKSINPLTNSSLPRVSNKVTIVAESNDIWKMDVPSLNITSQRNRADLKEEFLELELPENKTWADINFDLSYTPYDSNIGANVTAKTQKFSYSQKGYVLDAISNTIPNGVNQVSSQGGDYNITFKGDYPLDTEIRVIDTGNTQLSKVTASGPYTEQPKVHSLNIPAYDQWFGEREYTVQFMKADWTNVVTNYKQKGPYYILGGNNPSNGIISGEVPVNMTRKVRGDGKVKVKVVMTKDGQTPTEFETTPQDLTLAEGDLNYTIPTNPGGDTREVKAYIVTVGGQGGKEELIFSGTQRGEFYFGYITSGSSTGGNYSNAYVQLYGNAPEGNESTVYVQARANTGESRNTTYKVRELKRAPGGLVTVNLPINSSTANKVWSLYFNGNGFMLISTHTQLKP